MIKETTDKIKFVKEKMKEAQDRQKSYADKRRKELEFQVGEMVYLKRVTFKGKDRTAKMGKLQPRYMGPFRIVERIGPVAYSLELPDELHPFHEDVFHVSQLRKVVRDPALIVPQPPEDLCSGQSTPGKPMQVTRLPDEQIRRKRVPMVELVWERDGLRETTKESASMVRAEYPELFENQGDEQMTDADSRMNS